MDLSGLAIGDVAFVGIPGEPFAGIKINDECTLKNKGEILWCEVSPFK